MDNRTETLLAQLRDGKFTFIDLGCGTGEFIRNAEKRYGAGCGVGFDISERKVQQAQAKGVPVALADITKLEFPSHVVRFATMMDFLEHLYTIEDAVKILRAAGHLCRDFIYIRHPSFEDVAYLASLGLKLGWTHWTGHRNMMTLAQFAEVFDRLGWARYHIIPRKKIVDSRHPAIVPLTAPIDCVRYDPAAHGPKPLVLFTRPVFSQFDIIVQLNPDMDQADWDQVVSTGVLGPKVASAPAPGARRAASRPRGVVVFARKCLRRLLPARHPDQLGNKV